MTSHEHLTDPDHSPAYVWEDRQMAAFQYITRPALSHQAKQGRSCMSPDLVDLENPIIDVSAIREHGEDAGLEAAMRADAMLEKGDLAVC